MSISYDGIGYLAVSMETSGSVLGHVCTVDNKGRACPCATDTKFIGVVTVLEDGLAAVQVEGFVKVSYSIKPTVGYNTLLADGAGGVKTSDGGKEYLVVAVDIANRTATIKL